MDSSPAGTWERRKQSIEYQHIIIFIRISLFFYSLICLLCGLAELNYSNGETQKGGGDDYRWLNVVAINQLSIEPADIEFVLYSVNFNRLDSYDMRGVISNTCIYHIWSK